MNKKQGNPLFEDWDGVDVIDTDLGELFKLDTIGDTFVGIYRDLIVITKDTRDGEEEVEAGRFFNPDGDPVAMWTNADLSRKLHKVVPESIVRIEYVTDLDVGQISPMRVYKVQQKV
ncbi:MAG: hypothetical protein GY771_05305 [bacterium]|nr:hypothetical protein [bacterium]